MKKLVYILFFVFFNLEKIIAAEELENKSFVYLNEFGQFKIWYDGHLYFCEERYHALECPCNRGY